MRQRRYTDKQFIEAIKNSFSRAEVLRKLDLKLSGGNYKLFKKRVKEIRIDISYFTGQGHLKGKTHNWKKKKSFQEIMVQNSSYSRGSLKTRLIKEKVLENKCFICGQESKWKNKKLVMVLDHINGVNNDHRKENLRLLCPNCNSQTDTFTGRNCKRKKKEYYCNKCKKEITIWYRSGLCKECSNDKRKKIKKVEKFCFLCDKKIVRSKSGLCHPCAARKVKIRPSKEILLKEIEETNYCAVGRKYGVSDNAVRKWLR